MIVLPYPELNKETIEDKTIENHCDMIHVWKNEQILKSLIRYEEVRLLSQLLDVLPKLNRKIQS